MYFMKLSYFTKQVGAVKHCLVTALFCLAAIAFVWQGAFWVDTAATAAPMTTLMASKDAGDQVQDKVRTDAGRAKGFIEDTKNKVERTANKNANRVDRATDDNGSFLERRAKNDAGRIEKRAEEDAARTEKAVDNTKNAVERTVDSIKDAFGN
jgi:hypothetical protein